VSATSYPIGAGCWHISSLHVHVTYGLGMNCDPYKCYTPYRGLSSSGIPASVCVDRWLRVSIQVRSVDDTAKRFVLCWCTSIVCSQRQCWSELCHIRAGLNLICSCTRIRSAANLCNGTISRIDGNKNQITTVTSGLPGRFTVYY
jgi:hypothetical protein